MEPGGHSAPLSSHCSLASGSTKRRISQAQARRSAHSGRRVAQLRPVQRVAGRRRVLRLHREQQLLHRRLRLGQRLRRALARGRGKEIERGDGLELAALLVQHARERAGVRHAETDAQALDGLGERVVARGAVEQALQLLLLRVVRGFHVQHAGDARVLRHVAREPLQRAAVVGGVGQHVHAFAQHRGAERFQRAQHAHARRGILGGKTGDGDQPAAAGGRILRRRCAVFRVHGARRLLHSAAALIYKPRSRCAPC